MNKIISQDMKRIFDNLSTIEKSKLNDSTFLFTGGAGFLGFYFITFLITYQQELNIKKIICLDNFQSGYPKWLKELSNKDKIKLYNFNVITDNISNIPDADTVDFVFHMASIASPLFYRKYPLQTLDANILGLRNLLEFYSNKKLKGFVFLSSSEIYGDPTSENIPTPETYRGNVDCQGPRACYDEAKRFGETICYLFNQKYNMPISIIRPFNNYGPGMRLNDARVPADFANAVRQNKNIVLFSDGTPTRTFCYISDSITGYLKCICHANEEFNTFNIGIDKPEITISQLADIYIQAGKEIFNYKGKLEYAVSNDKDYLKNNPTRRCPSIDKARKLLGYNPVVSVEQGVRFFLEYIKESSEDELIW